MAMKQKPLPANTEISGNVSGEDGLRDFLETLITSKEVKQGIARLQSQTLSGAIGIFSSRYITGAMVENSTVTGFEALRQLLSLRNGTYSFCEAGSDDMAVLRTSVAIDVLSLLDWAQPDSCTPPPLERSLDAIVELYAQTMAPSEHLIDESAQLQSPLAGSTGESTPAENSFFQDPLLINSLRWSPESGDQNSIFSTEPLSEPAINFDSCDNQAASHSIDEEHLELFKQTGGHPTAQVGYMLTPYNPEDLDAIPTPSQAESISPDVAAESDPADTGRSWTQGRMKPISDRERHQVGEIYREQQRLASPLDFIKVKKATGDTQKAQPITFRHKGFHTSTIGGRVIVGFVACMTVGLVMQFTNIIIARERSNDLFVKGLKEFETGSKVVALIDFDASVRANSNNAEAVLMLGTTHAQLGNYDDALSQFLAARQLLPKDIRAYVGTANCLLKRNDYAGATSILNDAIRLQPQNASAHGLRTIAYAFAGKYGAAIDDANQAMATAGFKPSAETFAARAYAEWKTGQFREALSDYSKSIEADGGDSKAFLGRGCCHMIVGELDAAIADLSQAIKLDPASATSYIWRGKAFGQQNELKKALADLDKAVSLQRRSAEAFAARGNLFLQAKEFGKAIADYDDSLSVQPDNPEVSKQRDLAYSLVKQQKPIVTGDHAELERTAGAPLKLTARSLPPFAISQAALQQSDPEIASLTRKLHSSPNDTQSRRYLAYALMRTGNVVAASEQFHMLDSAGALAAQDKFTFADMLARGGNLMGAASVYKRMLVINPRDEAARSALVKVYIQLGRDDEADALTSFGALQGNRRYH
jgi:tetratricopeptide (TPR) repeat protein